MQATAHRTAPAAYTHRIDIRQHELVVDEPREQGGDDAGPTPQELLAASLAGCTAITIEMYAKRKEWEIGPVEVEVAYDQPERGQPANFKITLRFPESLSPEQVQRLSAIAAKCPVHRTLEGEVTFEQNVEPLEAAAP